MAKRMLFLVTEQLGDPFEEPRVLYEFVGVKSEIPQIGGIIQFEDLLFEVKRVFYMEIVNQMSIDEPEPVDAVVEVVPIADPRDYHTATLMARKFFEYERREK